MGFEFWMLALCALLLLVLGLLSFLWLDSDLTLLRAAWMGQCPEQALADKVVWITGASSGIGEELAFQLSKLGVCLVLSARRGQELERVKRRCLENGNLKEKDILVLPLDLADTSSHDIATKTVLQEFGRIDILVNNGGIVHASLFENTNLDVFKVLIEGFVGALRTELFDYPGIRLSTICPGHVHSNIFQNFITGEFTKTRLPEIPLFMMETSRCVQLILVSLANDLEEVWIANQPVLLRAYVWQYVPFRDWILQGCYGKYISKALGITWYV
ncbi:dehydrogenase/reductase SDR family member 7-like isoform X4 [Rattus norvegicus]|uniref:dehydrogenase/reductase SDR family member 7-like isoform X4 n=1 Tax=Rattus norvegicus TaxID=10116 RepID=UPI0003D0DD05|nr:dehydrogenase/reductase SDR family member 7-like isoform X4 [Rattus norvegicus]